MSKVHPEGEASETHTVRTGGRRPEPPGRAEGSSGGAGVGARRLARFLPRPQGSSRGKREAGDSDGASRRSRAVESWQGPPRGLQARSAQALPAVPSGDGGGQQRSWPKSPPMSLPLTRLQLRPGLHTPAPPESPVPLAARATTGEQASVACGHCPHLGQHRDLPAPQCPPPPPRRGRGCSHPPGRGPEGRRVSWAPSDRAPCAGPGAFAAPHFPGTRGPTSTRAWSIAVCSGLRRAGHWAVRSTGLRGACGRMRAAERHGRRGRRATPRAPRSPGGATDPASGGRCLRGTRRWPRGRPRLGGRSLRGTRHWPRGRILRDS